MMKKIVSILLCLALAAFPGPAAAEGTGLDGSELFSSRDLLQEADLTDAVAVQLQGESVTIDRAGVYLLSGQLEDGQIIVDAGAEDKVQLVLSGVRVHTQGAAAIQVKAADKVFITLEENSDNVLSADTVDEGEGIDGVIFSKADLTLNGGGQLTVTGEQGHGIVCKDTLVITGGSYSIQAAQHGITGKDGLYIADGSFTITAGEDGLRSKNSDDSSLGNVYVSGGSFTLVSGDKGISATGWVQLDGGSFTITSGGGSENADMKASDAFGPQGGWWGGTAAQTSDTETNAKGIKADGAITVNGGVFTLDCADDGVHAAGSVTIAGGQWSIQTADDGIHSDRDVFIRDGSIQIPYCYEGIEGKNVTIDGGAIQITANDDGLNATGEETGGNFWGGDTGAVITVNGGAITVVSGGDCLDSNGTILLNGGTLNLTCNGNGNTALDSESGVTNNGADVTTNDGSENGSFGGRGQMGGNRGQFGGQFGGENPGKGQFDGGKPGGGGFFGGNDPSNQDTPPEGAASATPPSGNGQAPRSVPG